MTAITKLNKAINCRDLLEKMGITYTAGAICPIPKHRDMKCCGFTISHDGGGWTCNGSDDRGGDMVDLFCMIVEGKRFRELEPDVAKHCLRLIEMMAGKQSSSSPKRGHRIRKLAGQSGEFKDIINSQRLSTLRLLYNSAACPRCGGTLNEYSYPIFCDIFECSDCGLIGENIDWLSQHILKKAYYILDNHERTKLAENWYAVVQNDPNWDMSTRHGAVFYLEKSNNNGKTEVATCRLNQLALAQAFLDSALIFHSDAENALYEYEPATGVWSSMADSKIMQRVTRLHDKSLLRALEGISDPDEFLSRRTHPTMMEICKAVRNLADIPFLLGANDIIAHVGNGVLVWHKEARTLELKPFSPGYFSRNRTMINYNPSAACPRFMNELLGKALNADDQMLLQKYAGQCLLALNQSQTFLIIRGTAGGGKGTVLTIVQLIVGTDNCTELRPSHLTSRFEISRMQGKSLLCGNDAPGDFLNNKAASMIKAIVGGDLMFGEMKNSNKPVKIERSPNLIICTNSRLRVNIETDKEAWRRRMLIVDYTQPPVEKPIPDFAQLLVEQEGEGILAWAVEGARMLLDDLHLYGKIQMSAAQIKRRDDLLAESDSVETFINERIERCDAVYTPCSLIYDSYVDYCNERGWEPADNAKFGRLVPQLIMARFKVSKSHDIPYASGQVRGYRNIRIKPML